MSKSTFPELWKLTKDIQQCVFIQENWLNLSSKKPSDLCAIFAFLSLHDPFTSPFHQYCESNTFTIILKSSRLTASGGEGTGLDLFKIPNPREGLLFDLSGSFLGNPISKTCLYLADTELAQCKQPFPGGVCQKTISHNCLISQMPEIAITNRKHIKQI